MNKLITIYFDFTSPYSYLAFEKLNKIRFSDDAKLIFKPVVVGKIISSHGGVGPALIKAKRDYLFKDAQIKALADGVSFMSPRVMPFNPLFQLRAAIHFSNTNHAMSFITETFRHGWQQGKDYEDYENYRSYILETTSITESEYQEMEENNSTRKELKKNIAEALDRDVFGVPSLCVDDRIFWGHDSLEMFKNYLEGQDQYSDQLKEEFIRFQNIIDGEKQ